MSYVLTKPDGSKIHFQHQAVSHQQNPDYSRAILSENLSEQSGKIVIQSKIGAAVLMEIEGALRDGKAEGTYRHFVLLDGKRIKTLEQDFRNDLKDGRSTAYFHDGTLMYEGSWRDGLRHGKWIFHAFRFRPALILTFEADQLHGEVTIHSPTGAVIAQGEYHHGSPKNGTFITDPWDFIEAVKKRSKSFNSSLLSYRDGQQIDSKPITLETGI